MRALFTVIGLLLPAISLCAESLPDFASVYSGSRLSPEEITRRESIFLSASRTPVMIVDATTDLLHPDLYYRIDPRSPGFLSPDFFRELRDLRSRPAEDPTHDKYRSHGSMVSSIALRNSDAYSLFAVPNAPERNESNADFFPKISQLIRKHSIRFANLSFDIAGPEEDPSEVPMPGNEARDLRPALRLLLEENPRTLFTVVSGNDGLGFGVGYDLGDRDFSPLMPQMACLPNVLVIAALDTDKLELSGYPRYRLAPFSNYGERYVDIAAPGVQLCGARTGGGTICANGTSFASPFTLNQGVLRVHHANPGLSPLHIREILLKTAYIPAGRPLPVRSGGILYPERAVTAAGLMKAQPHLSAEQAALRARRLVPVPPGEASEAEAKALWKIRKPIGKDNPCKP